jgi:hypothetical protein
MRNFYLILIVAILLGPSTVEAESSLPQYAQAGAFVSYTAIGGFIPFFGGVSGQAKYTVMQVFTNGSMLVMLNETISQGEVGSQSNVSSSKYFLDNAYSPSVFPALPASSLGQYQVRVQGIVCNLTGQVSITVPAGTFLTYEYIGRDSNGTTQYYWFDSASGVVVEMSSGVSAMQMTNSNIAFPSSQPTSSSSELPYVVVVLLAWGFMGGLFLWIRRHYSSVASVHKFSTSYWGSGSASKIRASITIPSTANRPNTK